MEENIIRDKILQIVNNVLQDFEKDVVVKEDNVINLPFTIEGPDFEHATALSSLEIVTIVVEVENEFQIEILDDDMLNFRTVNDLTQVVEKILSSREEDKEEYIWV